MKSHISATAWIAILLTASLLHTDTVSAWSQSSLSISQSPSRNHNGATRHQTLRYKFSSKTKLNLRNYARDDGGASSSSSLTNKAFARSDYESVSNPRRSSSPSASTVKNSWSRGMQQTQQPSIQDFWLPVLSSAALITGNTFGAGSLVLPHLAAEPGLGPTTAVMGAAYLLNLLSGLTLANVAISQYETQCENGNEGDEVPSSFQEFVQATLNNPELATFISCVSFGVNSLVLAFDISRVGFLFQGTGVDPAVANVLWSGALVALSATQTTHKMSQAASFCVMALFASFGTLLLPGLAGLTDPMGDWFAPGTAASDPSLFWSSVGNIAPVVVMCTIFQNIVPTIVKIQGYDRTKSYSAIVLGTLMPLVMYIAWCWACLGQGGIDLDATMNGLTSNPMLAIFSLATLAGSSIGCSLSCASELDIFVKKFQAGEDETPLPQDPSNKDEDSDSQERFQLASVLATVGLPLGLNFAFASGGDLTGALHVAGSLGSPLLYGVIPSIMAYKQMKDQEQDQANPSTFGKAGLGLLGFTSTGMLFGNLADTVASAIPSVLPSAVAATEVMEAITV